MLAPNGKIYMIPYNATQVGMIDPDKRTVAVIGTVLGGAGSRYAGGALASNGKVYGFPYNNTTFLEIDPSNDTVRELGSLPGAAKWAGGVAAPNGNLYGTQGFIGTALVIDPTGPTASTITGTGVGSPGHVYEGAILGPDGNVYWPPAETATPAFATLNTQSGTITRFGSNAAEAFFTGAVGSNGKIYLLSVTGGKVAEIDTATLTVNRFGAYASAYVGGALAANGKIYGVPNSGTTYLELDPAAQVITERSTGGSTGWQGAVLAPNGKIYGVPLGANTILEIDPKSNGNVCAAIALSGYLNKL